MATYHYSACHTCRVVGMLPKTDQPEEHHKGWVEKFGHADHEHQFAIEYDQEFEARYNGEEIIGYDSYSSEAITKKVAKPYTKVDEETDGCDELRKLKISTEKTDK